MTALRLLVLLALLAVALLPLIPIRRRRQAGLEGFPFVTVALLIVNVFLFAAGANADGVLSDSVALHWGLIPRHPTLITLLTYMFLHATWEHVFGNMLGLWLFGPHVEEALGKLEYFLFYLGAGIVGGLVHVIVTMLFPSIGQAFPLVGASGAIFGVLGLYAVRFWRTRMRVLLLFNVPSAWAVGTFALLQVIAGITSLENGDGSQTANWAHVGGFLFGLAIAFPLRMREDSRIEYSLEDAEAAKATGRPEQAANHYRKVLAATPDNADAHRSLAQVSTQLRQAETAHQHYQEALRLYIGAGNSPAVANTYQSALTDFEVFPLPPAMLQRIASACEETQSYPFALTALSEICRDYPATQEGEMASLRLGRLYLHKLNEPQLAATICIDFLRKYPESSWRSHAERLLAEATNDSAAVTAGTIPDAI